MTLAAEQSAESVTKPRSCRSIFVRGALALLAVLAAAGVAAWAEREALLRSAAELWIVSDPLAPADAVAVFGGGLDYRPFAAAEYYRQGLVKKVLLPNIGANRAEQLGVLMSHVEANRRVLLTLGVPASDIETFGANLQNTREEAIALRDWAERAGIHSVIVPTELFSARRLRWTLHQIFADRVMISVPALEPAAYRRDNWWRSPQGLIVFQNEVMKYLYYRYKY
ncbi:MAG: hypothetical protein QOD40_3077 [Alphaproteobacteria bacterium]|jgi:uncharacterized SAM-binding protein YcdF (DUF218 family)|nr:hypothetical protein [Alphaproteobacteria bacterium]